MAGWTRFEQQAPEVAEAARVAFTRRVHHMLATVRRDGAPRVSGTEVIWARGDLWLGSMWESPKARDLRRDPRYALHSGSDDPPNWEGDAKVAGTAEEVTDPDVFAAVQGTLDPQPPARFHLFRLHIDEAITLRLNEAKDMMVATRWTPDGGVTVREMV